MSHIIFITIAILIVCLASTSWYIRLRFDKTPKEDKWFDNIVYIFCPLLTTCIGVLFALWIDRNEADIRQREATVKTLKLCQLDANNALDLIKRHDSLSQELYTAEYILRASAATTAEERNKCMDALLNLVIPVKSLVTISAIIARVHPEGLDVDELPEPFNELEKMTEEEIAEWIMAQIKLAKEGMTE